MFQFHFGQFVMTSMRSWLLIESWLGLFCAESVLVTYRWDKSEFCPHMLNYISQYLIHVASFWTGEERHRKRVHGKTENLYPERISESCTYWCLHITCTLPAHVLVCMPSHLWMLLCLTQWVKTSAVARTEEESQPARKLMEWGERVKGRIKRKRLSKSNKFRGINVQTSPDISKGAPDSKLFNSTVQRGDTSIRISNSDRINRPVATMQAAMTAERNVGHCQEREINNWVRFLSISLLLKINKLFHYQISQYVQV